MIRELENEEFILYSEEQRFNNGTVKYLTWVTIKADNFRISYRHHDTEALKDAYVEEMRPRF